MCPAVQALDGNHPSNAVLSLSDQPGLPSIPPAQDLNSELWQQIVHLGENINPSSTFEVKIGLAEILRITSLTPDSILKSLAELVETKGLVAKPEIGANGVELVISRPESSQDRSIADNTLSRIGMSVRLSDFLTKANSAQLTREEWLKEIGDPVLMNALMEHLTPKLRAICYAIVKRKGITSIDEFLQNGRIALWEILNEFDPKKGSLAQSISFKLYRRIIDTERTDEPLLRSRLKAREVLQAAEEHLIQEDGARVRTDDPRLMDKLGGTEAKLRSIIAKSRLGQMASFDEDRDNLAVGSREVISKHSLSPIENVILEDTLNGLSPRNRHIAELILAGVSQKDLASIFDLSESRIGQLTGALRESIMLNQVSTGIARINSNGLGFSVLEREIEILDRVPSNWDELLDYVDGLSFFSRLKVAGNPAMRRIKEWVSGDSPDFFYDNLPDDSRRAIDFTLQGLGSTIDDIHFHHFYCDLFRLPRPSVPRHIIAAECLSRGIFSPEIPAGHPFSLNPRGGCATLFVSATLLGRERVEQNVVKMMQGLYPTPDHISNNVAGTLGLMNLLGLGGSRLALAKWGFDHGVWKRYIPAGHPAYKPDNSHLSAYLDPDANRPDHIKRNLNSHFVETYPNVDDVTASNLFANFFGVSYQAEAIAKAAVDADIGVQTQRPPGYPLTRNGVERSRNLAFFYLPAVVGFKTARENLQAWVAENVRKSVDLQSRLLVKALNLTRRSGELGLDEGPVVRDTVRAALRERGWI